MYKKLWKKLNQNHTVAHTAAIYLTVMTLGWMLAGLLVGGLADLIIPFNMESKITLFICFGGYGGLIFGLFGGIFYLSPLNLKKRNCPCLFSAYARAFLIVPSAYAVIFLMIPGSKGLTPRVLAH